MSGQSEKKRKKAEQAAWRRYLLWVLVINAFYVVGRLLPAYAGYLKRGDGASGSPGAFGLLRAVVCFLAQYALAKLLSGAAGENAAAGKNSDARSGEHFFDGLAVLLFCEASAVVEFWWRRKEGVWWLSLLLPAGGCYHAWAFLRPMLEQVGVLKKSGAEADAADAADAAKNAKESALGEWWWWWWWWWWWRRNEEREPMTNPNIATTLPFFLSFFLPSFLQLHRREAQAAAGAQGQAARASGGACPRRRQGGRVVSRSSS